jgi:hypothetical protein
MMGQQQRTRSLFYYFRLEDQIPNAEKPNHDLLGLPESGLRQPRDHILRRHPASVSISLTWSISMRSSSHITPFSSGVSNASSLSAGSGVSCQEVCGLVQGC